MLKIALVIVYTIIFDNFKMVKKMNLTEIAYCCLVFKN